MKLKEKEDYLQVSSTDVFSLIFSIVLFAGSVALMVHSFDVLWLFSLGIMVVALIFAWLAKTRVVTIRKDGVSQRAVKGAVSRRVVKQKYGVSVVLFFSEPQSKHDSDFYSYSGDSHHSTLTIIRLYVPAEDRRQGLGSLVMNELCRHADTYRWRMRLDASSRFGTDEIVLTDFYARFGFDCIGSNEDGEPTMERPEWPVASDAPLVMAV